MRKKRTIIPKHIARALAERTVGVSFDDEEYMDAVMDQFARDYIRLLCRRHSDQKSVAIHAGIDPSNFTKWLKGKSTLSSAKLGQVLTILGVNQCTLEQELTAREIIEKIKHLYSLKDDGEILPHLKNGKV